MNHTPDPGLADHHRRPDGADDDTVAAVGALSEALETVERARGHLFGFHQLTGSADLKLGEAVEQLEKAGHTELAAAVKRDLVGRNVLPGRWTFQIVDEYEDGYYSAFRHWERKVRDELLDGRRHIAEAEMKADRVTPDHPDHTMAPPDTPGSSGSSDSSGSAD